MERVGPKLPLLERMRLLTPSETNQICGCAGNLQCVYCVVGEATNLIQNIADKLCIDVERLATGDL